VSSNLRTVRLRLARLLVVTLAVGIASRVVHLGARLWDKSVGDALYAVAIYLVVALIVPRWKPRRVAILAFAICLAVELFQLTGIPIALAREHPWVRWILGGAFGWHDVAWYAVGVAAIALIAQRYVWRRG
jgi:hypothetical protein